MKDELTKEELFPYESFPVRLELKKENRICWFKDEVDLQKYVDRYRLDKKVINIDYRYEKPPEPSKRNKRSVGQKTKSKSNSSTSSVRKRKSSVDSTGNTSRNSRKKTK